MSDELPTVAEARKLLGRRVRVHLDGQTVVTGRLLGLSTDGEFEVSDGQGTVHYCWPMLKIEAIDE